MGTSEKESEQASVWVAVVLLALHPWGLWPLGHLIRPGMVSLWAGRSQTQDGDSSGPREEEDGAGEASGPRNPQGGDLDAWDYWV